MPKPLQIELNASEKAELEAIRDTSPLAYMRERAAAILKVADGMSGSAVAREGLLKRRQHQTVNEWVKRYKEEGIAGLNIRPGRGRKPAFSPEYVTEEEAQAALLQVVRQAPGQFGHQQSRWTLRLIHETCDWLPTMTEGGVSQLLKRLGIRYKRGRDYIHSPDPYYAAKVSYLTLCQMKAYYEPEKYVFLYLDEISYYRQPTVSRAYEALGHHQPLAYRSLNSNTLFRGIGALNFLTGQVTYRQHHRTTLPYLSAFYAHIRADYPDAEVIYVAQDNWPVHVHPNVIARLQSQESPFWPRTPGNWPTEPNKKAIHDDLPIQLVFVPTYAPWLNPIEQLWRWLKQDVLHLHRISDEWHELKQRVLAFMAQFAHGSTDLLRYVGLLYD